MHQLFRFIEPTRPCSYLPAERASLEIRCIESMAPAEYANLLSRGYRRFGRHVFRPACAACVKCVSVRIATAAFAPSMSERRVLRKNQHIRAELHPLFATHEHVALYNRYQNFMHGFRAWPAHHLTERTYREEFLTGAHDSGRQWLYFDNRRLVGVALMDEVPGAVSLIYFFYDPDWRAASPGTYSILNQILYAKSAGRPHAYLGYWIDSCQSMSYKGRFHPREILKSYPSDTQEPVWE